MTIPYQLIEKEKLYKVYHASMKILEEKGVEIKDNDLLEKISHSSSVEIKDNIVRFKKKFVNRALENIPSKVVLKARDPEKDLVIGYPNSEHKTLFTNGFGSTKIFNPEKNNVREANFNDLVKFTKLAHSLEKVDYCLFQVTPRDVSANKVDIYSTWALLNNTDKHIHLGIENPDSLSHISRIMEICSQDFPGERRPFYSIGGVVDSPLQYSELTCKKMIFAAENQLPFIFVGGGIAGVTTPVTIAGGLSLQHAEILAGITMMQIINPDLPCMYGTFTGPMNMRTGKLSLGSPELSLINIATAQLCEEFEIPFAYGTGGLTDAKIPGLRAGFEKAMTITAAALGGVEVIHHGVSGLLHRADISCYEQMVIDNEICKTISRLMKGFDVTEDTIAYDLISEVEHGGNFLEETHTLNNFKEEIFISDFFDESNKKDLDNQFDDPIYEVAREKVNEITGTERKFISKEAYQELEEYMNNL